MPGADAFEDLLEVLLRNLGWDAAQSVVRAKREDEDVRRLPQDPIDAPQSAGRGLAAQAGVDDPPGQVRGRDFFLNQGGVGIRAGLGESVARGQAVTEEDNRAGLRPGAQDARRGRNQNGNETAKETGVHGRNTTA